ncbi:GntR family transcriptional regulator [Microbulbifer pacificus]|uniref:GntR family transcriptional regulator n=1 Tax=Microbulbifer pacificus TaxID=407164 RepID=A0AAU0N2P3_9GAMM|nr:GntR family transcriptional regulator [Microbulbifer pacificus]WOX07045.1 GntR family transcriptional regulator [Microbulbifer pacificus]
MESVANKKRTKKTSDSALVGHRVTEQIRDLILSNELPPGSRISQESLAERFGTSRIPVRDALNRLESDGLVVLKPSSGAWVAKLDFDECVEIYKIRERIEPLALSESAKKMTDEDINHLQDLVEQMEVAQDTETFLKLDREFHLASYRASNMDLLNEMVHRFWNTTQQYRRAFTEIIGNEGAWVIHAEHRLMIEALRRRDSEGASQMLHEHIRRTRIKLEEHSEVFNEK